MTTAHATPFYCPYCAEEDLRPVPEPEGGWECHDCTRVFAVRFLGLASRASSSVGGAAS